LLILISAVPKKSDGDSFAHGWNYVVGAALVFVVVWLIALMRLAALRRRRLNGINSWTRGFQLLRAITWFGINSAADHAGVPRWIGWATSVLLIFVALFVVPK